MLTLNFLPFTNIPDYLRSVTPFLEKDETQNGLFLGAIDCLRHDPPTAAPVMVQVLRENEISGAAFYFNKNLLISGDFDGAAELLAQYLKDEGIRIPSVLGPVRETDAFAKAWSVVAGCEANLVCIQGLYRLNEIRPVN